MKNEEKSELRVRLLEARRSAHQQCTSADIVNATGHLLRELEGMIRVGVYCSRTSELPTDQAIQSLWSRSCQTYFPLAHSDGTLTFHQVQQKRELKPGRFGILEPDGDLANSKDLDAVVVPGVGFDTYGNRLGMGRGYYDRFLATTNATRIGFGYPCQLVPHIPVEKHDLPMDSFVSSYGVTYFAQTKVHRVQ